MRALQKIQTFPGLVKICQELRRRGKTIGLITGCFDILHIGHVELFKFAKKHCDILVVGLDNDKTIRLSKGKGHPLFNARYRSNMLSAIEYINYIFSIPGVFKFEDITTEEVHKHIMEKLQINVLVTNPNADKFWGRKKQRMKNMPGRLIFYKRKRLSSSTKLAEKLGL